MKDLRHELAADLERALPALAAADSMSDAEALALAGNAYLDDEGRVVSTLPVDVTLPLLARGPATQARAMDLQASALRFLDLRGFEQLRRLDVAQNPELREIRWLPPLLEELVLDESPVLRLPLLPQLRSLSSVGGHAKLTLPRSLVSLNLTRAFVTAAPSGLPRLETLNLEGTMVRMLGTEPATLPALTSLNLADTPLTRIYEGALRGHPSLRVLDVRNTPFARSGQVQRLKRQTHPRLVIHS